MMADGGDSALNLYTLRRHCMKDDKRRLRTWQYDLSNTVRRTHLSKIMLVDATNSVVDVIEELIQLGVPVFDETTYVQWRFFQYTDDHEKKTTHDFAPIYVYLSLNIITVFIFILCVLLTQQTVDWDLDVECRKDVYVSNYAMARFSCKNCHYKSTYSPGMYNLQVGNDIVLCMTAWC